MLYTQVLPPTLPKPPRIAVSLAKYCSNITKPNEKLTMLQLNLQTRHQSSARYITRKHLYSPLTSTAQFGCPEKVLMVVGATGAGKTTLINGMINYIMGVKWKDNFRFKLIREETTENQAHSQTQKITAYTIHQIQGSAVPYTLTIIDTPGFGDTRGLERDKLIVDQIKELISLRGSDGIDHLDGIGFVTQSALARLTPTLKYIFHSILSVFGKDVVNNIFIMITFADDHHPPVLDAIAAAKIPHQNKFKFNNSAIFGSDEGDNDISEMFWKMGFSSFQRFFTDFSRAVSVSLSMTNEVLLERERLETTVQQLKPQIDEVLATMERIKQETIILERYKSDMSKNQSFQRVVQVPKLIKKDMPKGRYVTHCTVCNFTCHQNCNVCDKDRVHCSVMDRNGNCTVCKGKCHWHHHSSDSYYFEVATVKEITILGELKKKYDTALSCKTRQEDRVRILEKKVTTVKSQVMRMMHVICQSLIKLDEIALKPNPLADVDLLSLLLDSEKQQKNPGYQQRIKFYEEAKRNAETFIKAKKGIENFPAGDDNKSKKK